MTSRIPGHIASRLRLPLIAAPMLRVSGPDLVIAACKAGVVGAFPTMNALSSAELEAWLGRIVDECGPADAPWCPNMIMRNPRLKEDLDHVIRHRAQMVITSVGSPVPVIGPLHDIGCLVFADVATLHHAQRAIEARVDGLILLTAGAGGQTGWMNPFAFTRAVRAIFDGPVVMAGGMSDGQALKAASVLGCDLAYMGTRFIATWESMASEGYRRMLVESSLDDVMLTSAFTGLRTSMLEPSIRAAGLDPARLDETIDELRARKEFGGGLQDRPKRWKDIWSAGHSVSGVGRVQHVAELVEDVIREYESS